MKEPANINQILNIREEAVFEELFKSHFAELVNFGNRYLNDPEQSKELVQEVFLNIWQKSEILKIQTSVKSYLFGAVRNAALNHIKHQKVQQKYQDRVKFNSEESETVDFLELEELKTSIENALNKIPEKCRQIFELNRFEGKRYKEIADQLGISLKTVENQMGKALKILRQELGDYLPIVLLLISLHGGKI